MSKLGWQRDKVIDKGSISSPYLRRVIIELYNQPITFQTWHDLFNQNLICVLVLRNFVAYWKSYFLLLWWFKDQLSLKNLIYEMYHLLRNVVTDTSSSNLKRHLPDAAASRGTWKCNLPFWVLETAWTKYFLVAYFVTLIEVFETVTFFRFRGQTVAQLVTTREREVITRWLQKGKLYQTFTWSW